MKIIIYFSPTCWFAFFSLVDDVIDESDDQDDDVSSSDEHKDEDVVRNHTDMLTF